MEATTSLTTTTPEARISLRLLAFILALAGLGLSPGSQAWAQAGIDVTDLPSPEYTFGKILTFRISARSDASIGSVTLLYRVWQTEKVVSGSAAFTPGQEVAAIYTLDPAAYGLAPFTSLEYWWEIGDEAGRQVTTEAQTFHYLDNRFDWQTVSQPPLAMHWYQGGPAFGQNALSIAAASLARANRALQATLPEAIDIYVYADVTDVQEALRPADRLWAEGRVDPALNLVVLAVSPGLDADLNLERELPHELTHLLIYQLAGQHYAQVPSWLNEGLAVMNQTRPDPEFAQTLAAAREGGKLLSLTTLCGPFPADPAQAQLAYAESESVVRYLRSRYADAGLSKLLAAYAANGATCESGLKQGLNLSLAELEQAWLRDTAGAAGSGAAGQLTAQQLPWVVLSALILTAGGLITLLMLGGSKPPQP